MVIAIESELIALLIICLNGFLINSRAMNIEMLVVAVDGNTTRTEDDHLISKLWGSSSSTCRAVILHLIKNKSSNNSCSNNSNSNSNSNSRIRSISNSNNSCSSKNSNNSNIKINSSNMKNNKDDSDSSSTDNVRALR